MTVALFLGVFHFANEAHDDYTHIKQIDVMSDASQTYLKVAASNLAKFKPTHVLLEKHPSMVAEINEQYQRYLSDKLSLDRTEEHQLGFRIAKASGLKRLYGFDEWRPLMKFDELLRYMIDKDPAAKKQFESFIDSYADEEAHAHATMDMQSLLLRTNQDDRDRANKAGYMSTNVVGAGDSFVGADATAAFWNRNFRMYANIQQHAGPNARLLVIAGQGHTAIFKDFAKIDQHMEIESTIPYLN